MNINRVRLGVNIDHIATLRQARGTRYPDPLQGAMLAEQAGADEITLHLREDRRHIQERDVVMMKEVLLTPMNLEMAATEEMLNFAEQIKPAHCCLVPERREELTTEGGLDVCGQQAVIAEACQRLEAVGIQVSLFIDAEPHQLDAACACGASAIEIHTGHYADCDSTDERDLEFDRIQGAVAHGLDLGLVVNAGHGLNYQNVQAIAQIPGLYTLNIGHSIIARAVFTGLESAVAEMKMLL